MTSKFILIVVGLILVLFSYSSAQVPQMINYQGKLTKSTGAPLDTTISMVFSIYADSAGTILKWTETQGAVIVEKGIFNVLLGNVNPIPDTVFNGDIRYLGVKVGGDPEITPRKSIVSVAYAFKSSSADTAGYALQFSGTVNNADKVDGLHASATATAGYLYPLDGSAKIPNDRLYTGAGNSLDADLLDGQHASSFLSTSSDYGRLGVATDLYEGASTLTSKYVNEGQANSVNSGMIQDNTITGPDISSSASLNIASMNTTGNVGIGTNSPIRALHLAWPTWSSEFVMEVKDGLADWRKWNFLVNGGTGNKQDLHLRILNDAGTGGMDIMHWLNNGNVGIGTSNPAQKLHVAGNAKVDDTLFANKIDLGAGEGMGYEQKFLFLHSGNARSGWGHGVSYEDRIFFPSDGHMSFGTMSLTDGTTWSEKVRIQNNGNVGIGTTNPQGALDVSSTTGAFIVPRMTTAQRDALTAVNGMIIYNTTTNQFNFRENGAWVTK